MPPSVAERAVGNEHPRVPVGLDVRSWEERVAAVAACAGRHATQVDAAARFPAEAVEAMGAEGLLGAWIEPTLGGLGASIEQIAWACGEIGQRCASSAMVFAMHQIQVASLVRHAGDSDWWTARLREIASTQRLIASATSEVGVGGDLRSSKCAIQIDGRERPQTDDAGERAEHPPGAVPVVAEDGGSPVAHAGDEVEVAVHFEVHGPHSETVGVHRRASRRSGSRVGERPVACLSEQPDPAPAGNRQIHSEVAIPIDRNDARRRRRGRAEVGWRECRARRIDAPYTAAVNREDGGAAGTVRGKRGQGSRLALPLHTDRLPGERKRLIRRRRCGARRRQS